MSVGTPKGPVALPTRVQSISQLNEGANVMGGVQVQESVVPASGPVVWEMIEQFIIHWVEEVLK